MGIARKSLSFILSQFKQHLSLHQRKPSLRASMTDKERGSHFSAFPGKVDDMAAYFRRCFCVLGAVCFCLVSFLSQMLKLVVNFMNFTLSEQFVNPAKVHSVNELFWERIRASNCFRCQIYLFGKTKMCWSQNWAYPRFPVILVFQYCHQQYLNGKYPGKCDTFKVHTQTRMHRV